MKTFIDYKRDIMALFDNYNVRYEAKLKNLCRELSKVFCSTTVEKISYAIQNADREAIDEVFEAWS